MYRNFLRQMTRNFYVYMSILGGLLERGKCYYDHHDVMIYFSLKGSTTFLLFDVEGVYYEKSQIFEVIGEKIIDGLVPLIYREPHMKTRFRYALL